MDEHCEPRVTNRLENEFELGRPSRGGAPKDLLEHGFVLQEVRLSALKPHPHYPRIGEIADAIGALDVSLFASGEGIHAANAPLVRRLPARDYEIIRGQRRIAAARRGFGDADTTILAYVAEHLDAAQSYALMLSGHSQVELSKLEIGILAYRAQETGAVTQQVVAERLGEHPANLSKYKTAARLFLALTGKGLLDSNVTIGCRDRAQHLYRLARVDDHTLAARLARECVQQEWSIDTVDAKVQEALKLPARPKALRSERRADQSGASSGLAAVSVSDRAPVSDPAHAQSTTRSDAKVPLLTLVRAAADALPKPSGAEKTAGSSPERIAEIEPVVESMSPAPRAAAIEQSSATSATPREPPADPAIFGVVTEADAALAYHKRRVNLRGEVDVAYYANVLDLELPADPAIAIGINRINAELLHVANHKATSAAFFEALAVVAYWESILKSPVFREYARSQARKAK